MPDYIPRQEANKVLWLDNFSKWVAANGITHGLTAPEIAALATIITDAAGALDACVAAQAAARGATAHKNTVLGAAVALARDYAQRLQTAPNVTDQDRADAGLTVPDDTPTHHAGTVHEIPPPLLLLDFSVRQQVTIHWGPNPGNEHQNARPRGVIGCEIQAARGGIPADPAQWAVLKSDTESPITHFLQETEPTTYAYRARYVGKKLEQGPFSDPAVCTVSV